MFSAVVRDFALNSKSDFCFRFLRKFALKNSEKVYEVGVRFSLEYGSGLKHRGACTVWRCPGNFADFACFRAFSTQHFAFLLCDFTRTSSFKSVREQVQVFAAIACNSTIEENLIVLD